MPPPAPRWFLEDAQTIADENPYTFYKPSAAVIALLAPGDGVKLIFRLTDPGEDDPSAERMWVEITAREGDHFTGDLDNTPRHIQDFPSGTELTFAPRHIIQISIDDPVPDPTLKWLPRCFVTDRVLDDGAPVRWMYREAPMPPQTDDDGKITMTDSGWRFFAGDEEDDYLDDPDNTHLVSLGAVLSEDDTMVHLLDAPVGAAFERDDAADGFVAVEDWEGPEG